MAPNIDMLPTLKNNLLVVEPMTPEQVERIHQASLAILEDVGVVFRDPMALDDWKTAGADVRGERVHLDRGLVMELISTIPPHITYHARNSSKNVELGGKNSIFVPMTGAPYLRDLDDNRRAPTIADLGTFHKLAHMMPALHSSAHHIVEPMDLVVAHRHLHITYSSMKYSDKIFMGMTTSPKNAEDVLNMCAILFGVDYLETHAVTTGNCNGNSPLVWDQVMLGAMRAFNRRNQPVLCSPFVLGGANTPASTAPAVAQLNAEALSALAYTQVVRKGCPAIYGHYLSTVSMQSGAPMAGTPEISLMNFMIGQMARRYNVPWRTSTLLGGAKILDAQAGYESAMTMMAVLLSGAHYLWHSAGWNEAGMHCSIAKFIVDSEVCAMGYRMAEGVNWDDFEEGLAAVRDVGPGGHYLGHPHTQANFQRAFFIPKLFDNNSIEQWKADGAKDVKERALTHAKRLLAEYEEPKLDPAKDEELRDYMARRSREIPAADALNDEY
jgi:trimethylamine--corrinoid protein Co-methyltransferase